MSSVRTQKKLLSDVRVLLRMIGCSPIRFVQTSSRTFKTFCCWVCFIVDDSIECLLLIIWIIVYSCDVLVYSETTSWILYLYYTSVNNVRCSYICLCISQMLWMDSNELEVLSCMNNKFTISYMTRDIRDIAVLYSICPLNNLMMTLNNSKYF